MLVLSVLTPYKCYYYWVYIFIAIIQNRIQPPSVHHALRVPAGTISTVSSQDDKIWGEQGVKQAWGARSVVKLLHTEDFKMHFKAN